MIQENARMRMAAVQSARSVALAAHSAAGIAHDVDRAAARLLRAAEGLSRSAIALLDVVARSPACGGLRGLLPLAIWARKARANLPVHVLAPRRKRR